MMLLFVVDMEKLKEFDVTGILYSEAWSCAVLYGIVPFGEER